MMGGWRVTSVIRGRGNGGLGVEARDPGSWRVTLLPVRARMSHCEPTGQPSGQP